MHRKNPELSLQPPPASNPIQASTSSTESTDKISIPDKWQNFFAPHLWKVCQNVHPGTGIEPSVLSHVEELLVKLLLPLLKTSPFKIVNVEKHVLSTLPAPINEWAVQHAHDACSKQNAVMRRFQRDRLIMQPLVPKLAVRMREELGYKPDDQVVLFTLAILEYIASDIFKVSGDLVRVIPVRADLITLRDMHVAVRADKVLMSVFFGDEDVEEHELVDQLQQFGLGPASPGFDWMKTEAESSYSELGRDLIMLETEHLRQLNLLIHVFKRSLDEAILHSVLRNQSTDLIRTIFGDISEVRDLSMRLLRGLEDTMEMSDTPKLGEVFTELCLGEEFAVYERYAETVLQAECIQTIKQLLGNSQVVERLKTSSANMLSAVEYVLPKLLYTTANHVQAYVDFLNLLKQKACDEDDREDLNTSYGKIHTIKSCIDTLLASGQLNPELTPTRWITQAALFAPIAQTQRAMHRRRLMDIQANIDSWTGKDIAYDCTKLIYEGDLLKLRDNSGRIGANELVKGKSFTQRHAFLFDNMFVLCKAHRRTTNSYDNDRVSYKLKEKLVMQQLVRRATLVDRKSQDSSNEFAFEVRERTHGVLVFVAKSLEEKHNWMAAIIMLQARSALYRMLDAHLNEEAKMIPLVLPSPIQYRFAEADMDNENIVFEDYQSSSGIPVVKAATIVKLIERLTYHKYTDPNFVRTFLTYYRSFCSPADLLDLLIERFDVPLPIELQTSNSQWSPRAFVGGGQDDDTQSICTVTPSMFNEALVDLTSGECPPDCEQRIQRFRKEFMTPIHVRTLSVMQQWVDKHWYDFENNEQLRVKMTKFLRSIKWNMLAKYTKGILAKMDRAAKQANTIEEHMKARKAQFVRTYGSSFPPILWNVVIEPSDTANYGLLTLHPIEMARQITLIESELYRAVRPIELVDAAWTKADKDRKSPQLMKLFTHSNNLTYWIEKQLVECENIEERVAIYSRVIEIMCVFETLNNFNGLMEFFSALNSAAVHRLSRTKETVDRETKMNYTRFHDMLGDGHGQKYKEMLRRCDPPCVPFFGHHLNTIFFLESGKKTYMTPDSLPPGTSHDPDTMSVRTVTEPLVLFNKCRKIADVIQDIQMYQQTSYPLADEMNIRQFFESLNPLSGYPDQNAFESYLYEQSLHIEPRDADKSTLNFPAKYPPPYLRSPGIKGIPAAPHSLQVKANTLGHEPNQKVKSRGKHNELSVECAGSGHHHSSGARSPNLMAPRSHSRGASPRPLIPSSNHHHSLSTGHTVPSTPPHESTDQPTGESDFAIVEIRGDGPHHVRDVPRGTTFPSSRYTPQPLPSGAQPPARPPKKRTSSSMGNGCPRPHSSAGCDDSAQPSASTSPPSTSNDVINVLPLPPRRSVPNVNDPISPPANSTPNRPIGQAPRMFHASGNRHSSREKSGTRFEFPPSASTGCTSDPESGPDPSSTTESARSATMPPLPPRKQAETSMHLPAPLSPQTFNTRVKDSPDVVTDSPQSPSTSSPPTSCSLSVSTPPPVLPPRIHNNSAASMDTSSSLPSTSSPAPPRPPKPKHLVKSPANPPLPPKTYKMSK